MSTRAPRLVFLFVGLVAASATAQVPQRLGPQTVANSTVLGNQDEAVAAADANGDFVVAWRADGQDGDGSGIVARRFSGRTGQPLSAEFVVNVTVVGDQRNPALAMADDGRFVVVWEGPDDGNGSVGLFGSLRQADGTPIVAEFPVNVTIAGDQVAPAVTMEAAGDFAVVWQSDSGSPNFGQEILGRIFRLSGGPGNEFQVNRITSGDQTLPAVAADRATGGWFCVWQGLDPSSGVPSIFYVELAPDGPGQDTEVVLNLLTPGLRQHAALAANPTGQAVAVWQGPDASGDGIFSRFIAGGVPVGAEEPVNLTTVGAQTAPAVALDERGLFVTAWIDNPLGEAAAGSPIIVQGRKKANGGSLDLPPPDAEFQISTSGANPAEPWIAAQPRGNFVVAWQAEGVDDPADPQGRAALFQRFADAIFGGDFESGNTGAWSLTVP
jgi:hypothetical protein